MNIVLNNHKAPTLITVIANLTKYQKCQSCGPVYPLKITEQLDMYQKLQMLLSCLVLLCKKRRLMKEDLEVQGREKSYRTEWK